MTFIDVKRGKIKKPYYLTSRVRGTLRGKTT